MASFWYVSHCSSDQSFLAFVGVQSATYHGQICIEIVFVFRSHDLVQVVASRPSGWDLVIFLEDRDVGVAFPGELKSRGETERASPDDSYSVTFGNTHGDKGRKDAKYECKDKHLEASQYVIRPWKYSRAT